MGVASAPLVCVLYDYKCYGTTKSSVSRAMQWKRGIVRLNVDVDVKASAKVNDEQWTTDNGRQSTTDSSSRSDNANKKMQGYM